MSSQSLVTAPVQHSDHTILSIDQSLALVKIFLNSSVACICHTRELIDWESDCFRKRYVDQISLESDGIYDDFCGTAPAAPGSSQEVRVLVRGSNEKADALLDMIENGVFSAVEASYLDQLQILIITKDGAAQAIQETYTYSFTYLNNAVASVELKEKHQSLSLSDAQRSFKAAIRNLLRSIKDLPQLPGECSLGISLSYNDACPVKYEPPGFVDAANNHVLPQDWERLWKESGKTISTFDAARHSIDIEARNSTFGYQTSSQINDTAVSKQLQNMQKTSSGRQPGLVSTLPMPPSPLRPQPLQAQPSLREQSTVSRVTRSASRVVQSSSPAHQLSDRDTSVPPRGSVSRRNSFYEAIPQESASRRSSRQDAVAQTPNPLRGLTIQSRNRRKRNIVLEKIAAAIVHAHCLDFEAEDGETIFDTVQLERGIIYRIDQADTIRCECGEQQNRDLMIYCHLCDSWQHLNCYGLSMLRSTSLPDQHLCYSCLLLPNEEDKVGQMICHVHMRLALMYISDLGSNTFDGTGQAFIRAVFGEQSDSEPARRRLLQRMVEEGVVCDGPDHIVTIRPVPADTRSRLQSEYLDPLANIGHLYQTAQGDEMHDIQELLRKYSGGRDYKLGVGVEDMMLFNCFGRPVVCWGYFDERKRNRIAKRKLTADGPYEPSPRRRKISISRAFIALDRSTPVNEDDYRLDTAGSYSDLEAPTGSTD